MSKEIKIVEVEGCRFLGFVEFNKARKYRRFWGGYKSSVTTISKDGKEKLIQRVGKFKTRDAARDSAIHFLKQTEPKGE